MDATTFSGYLLQQQQLQQQQPYNHRYRQHFEGENLSEQYTSSLLKCCDFYRMKTTRDNWHPWDRGMKIPKRVHESASTFIPMSSVESASADKESQDLMTDIFLQNNCLEHVFQVMSYHPRYLEFFLRTQQYILYGDGPLPFTYRHYIAIMAAARHRCSYLVYIQSAEFLMQHGDERWLKGIEYVPLKLRRLSEINNILAHRPWLITSGHIKNLVKGCKECTDNWTISELVQAIVLLAHFHSLASFVFGCGVTSETDHPDGHTFTVDDSDIVSGLAYSQPNGDSDLQDEAAGGSCIETLLETMQHIKDASTDVITEDEMSRRFEKIEKQNAELLASPTADKSQLFGGSISRFVDDPDFGYQDFAKRDDKNIQPFRASDFSWEDCGYSLGNGFYTDIGTLLDDKFSATQSLTYNTMGNKSNVDTTAFRRAIWNYIHSLFGIRHDDYDYSLLNKLLEAPLRSYVKIVMCYPERVTRADYDAFLSALSHSEKIHVNIMMLEAKLQAEVLYSFNVVNKYITYRT